MSRPFQQRKSGSRIGGDDDARRLDIALQIGVSKAIRNVILNSLQTHADFAFSEAKQALVDKIGKELPKWRQRTVDRLTELKVDHVRVERVIGRAAAEWLAPDIAKVVAMMKSVQDGMVSLDEVFPAEQAAEAQPEDKGKGLDEFAKGKADAPTEIENAKAGIDSAVATEIESSEQDAAIESDPTAFAFTPAYKLAQEIVIACEKAKTDADMADIRGIFAPRLKLLDKDDRLDIGSIRDSYEAWHKKSITDKQLEQSVFDRLELIKRRKRG